VDLRFLFKFVIYYVNRFHFFSDELQIKWKTKNSTLSEQFQNPIGNREKVVDIKESKYWVKTLLNTVPDTT
jgi:hypothetical protein